MYLRRSGLLTNSSNIKNGKRGLLDNASKYIEIACSMKRAHAAVSSPPKAAKEAATERLWQYGRKASQSTEFFIAVVQSEKRCQNADDDARIACPTTAIQHFYHAEIR